MLCHGICVDIERCDTRHYGNCADIERRDMSCHVTCHGICVAIEKCDNLLGFVST